MKVETVREGYAVRTEDGSFLTHEYYDEYEPTYEAGNIYDATLFYDHSEAVAAVENWDGPAKILPMRIIVIKEVADGGV